MKKTQQQKLIISRKETKNNAPIIKYILCFWCFVFIIIFASESKAEQVTQSRSVSIKQPSSADNKQELLIQSKPNVRQKRILKETYLLQKKDSFLKKSRLKGTVVEAKTVVHDFLIYDGYSQLYDDLDQDGYYHTFSILFDADVITFNGPNEANVYAEIYLSQNGGPWFHFYTTENFLIFGESSEDEFEVLSSLDEGYVPDNYDVLIELYEVGYSGVVASFSANDSNSLYALPLESYDYDMYDYDEDHHHGGSFGLIYLLLLLPIACIRLQKQQKNIK